jgi:hypothetical protein
MGTPTKAKSTKFTKIYAGSTDAPAGWIKIGEVVSFDGPNGTAPTIDASNFDSEEAEFIPGLSVPGEFQFAMNFVGSDQGQQQLDEDRVNLVRRYYKLEFADHDTEPSTRVFLAGVTMYSTSGATAGKYDAKAALKISGKVTKTHRPS